MHKAATPYYSPAVATYVKRSAAISTAARRIQKAKEAASVNPDWTYDGGDDDETSKPFTGEVAQNGTSSGTGPKSEATRVGIYAGMSDGVLIGIAVALLVCGVGLGAALTVGISRCLCTKHPEVHVREESSMKSVSSKGHASEESMSAA